MADKVPAEADKAAEPGIPAEAKAFREMSRTDYTKLWVTWVVVLTNRRGNRRNWQRKIFASGPNTSPDPLV